jgi:hypothetical protein
MRSFFTFLFFWGMGLNPAEKNILLSQESRRVSAKARQAGGDLRLGKGWS